MDIVKNNINISDLNFFFTKLNRKFFILRFLLIFIFYFSFISIIKNVIVLFLVNNNNTTLQLLSIEFHCSVNNITEIALNSHYEIC